LIAVDTSVVVAAFASWHEGHSAAREALGRRPRLPAHVALEVYSVLTRLPPPHRAGAAVVVSFLNDRFRSPVLTLPAEEHMELVQTARDRGITGGALYDGLVAATARHAGATLLTRDGRAIRTYEALNAAYELVT
jgi:predicted nucleic acid-binding protein